MRERGRVPRTGARRALNALSSLILALGLGWGQPGTADEHSGPNRTTLLSFPWGSLCYESSPGLPVKLTSTGDGFRITSPRGPVAIESTDPDTFRLTWGDDYLTVHQDGTTLELRGQDRAWTLRSQSGRWYLISSNPPDNLVFTRSERTFTIQGAQGRVTVHGPAEHLNIHSPLGRTWVEVRNGRATLAGAPLERIPYLGRGVYIPFHGAGVFIDLARQFPMPELDEWLGWRPILAPQP